jgi:hypothetical protein
LFGSSGCRRANWTSDSQKWWSDMANSQHLGGVNHIAGQAGIQFMGPEPRWYAWRAREDLMITPKFKSLGVTDFQTKSARELRDSRLEKKSICFVHQASRYRGKANYREALFLAYGPATETMVSGFADDTAIELKAFLAMAGAFAKHKIGTELWSAFVADVDAQKAFTTSPIDVWS